MTNGNVQSSRGVTLVGGGAPHVDDIRLLLQYAPDLVAADGGANACLTYGMAPIAAIGDFDSLDADTRTKLTDTRFIHVAEQDTTDFEKSLTNIDAPHILATGFTAKRLDHTLAVLSVLSRTVGTPVVVLGETDITFAVPTQIALPIAPKTRVSLFPMGPVQGTSVGLEWPIDGLELSPNGRIGTSNRAIGTVTLTFDQPGCLVILPRETLPIVLDVLSN
ncbi:MAG: thiamine diphosphokinase [Pseudomonadota bacterium]